MRPVRPTAVHKTDSLAELVCSNSFRGDKLDNAVGLLKEEMRRLGSLVMRAADANRVPAGAALAVDRERFAEPVTEAVADASADHHRPRGGRRAIPSSAPSPLILATGPLTSDALSAGHRRAGRRRPPLLLRRDRPIVLAESIDRAKVFRASRWDRSMISDRFAPDTSAELHKLLPIWRNFLRGAWQQYPRAGWSVGGE